MRDKRDTTTRGMFEGLDHDGETYDPRLDRVRLNAQQFRIYDVMRDKRWRTLAEIAARTGDPEASISARLRDLRKPKFGEFVVLRRRRGAAKRGLHEYRLLTMAAYLAERGAR